MQGEDENLIDLVEGAGEIDALALQLIARAQSRAWQAGDSRRRLGREAADQDGVAAWDAPRRRSRSAQADAQEDRGPGLAPGRDRPGPTRFDPRTGGADLHRAFDERGWASKLAVAQVVVRWEEIVGAQVAEHAMVSAFDVGRLDVQADSTPWAQQLRLLLPTIEAAIERVLKDNHRRHGGRGPTPRIEVRVFGPRAPRWGHGRYGSARGGRGPRDTYG